MEIDFVDFNAKALPASRHECLEEIIQIQRQLHGLANRLAAVGSLLERFDG